MHCRLSLLALVALAGSSVALPFANRRFETKAAAAVRRAAAIDFGTCSDPAVTVDANGNFAVANTVRLPFLLFPAGYDADRGLGPM
jgi:hypothetical protein